MVAKILNIFLGGFNSLYFFWVNGRCGARAYVCRKNESTPPGPPPGLKRLVPNYYFAFSCRPLGALVRFPMGGGGGARCNASLSQPNVQCSDKQQSPCEGGGGGLKI